MFKIERFIIVILLTLCAGFVCAKTINFKKDSIRLASFKYNYLLKLLDANYVDSINIKKITERAIANTLHQLDPHSSYVTKEELKASEELLQGEFSGIGIQFNILRDTLMVVSTIEGGPSEKVGLRSGDRIIKIDNENVAGVGLKNLGVTKRLRGDKGTKVTVYVKRKGIDELLDFLIVRDDIPINTVDASYMINDSIGYIKINRFGLKTADEFHMGLQRLNGEGMKKLIVDLTGNGGGYLRAAVGVIDELLSDLKLVVYIDGLHSPRKNYITLKTGLGESLPLVVLIDEGSASASEIVSGALQDWDRAVIVGRRSFGKGLVQNQFEMPDSCAVRITTGHYYTPSGRNIQKSYSKGVVDYYSEIYKRYQDGEMLHKDSFKFPDSLRFKTMVYKRTVYGGGGIMPDVFVPLDTTKNFSYLNNLSRKNIINSYAMDYADSNRKKLNSRYVSFKDFMNDFEVDEVMIGKIVTKGAKEGLKKENKTFLPIKKDLKLMVKALIARVIWGFGAYYEIINQGDDILEKGIEILNNNRELKILKK